MKVKIQGFLSKNHSWAFVNQNIARALIKRNHEVHLNSTNGQEHFPSDLLPFLRKDLDKHYDLAISYTYMRNFPQYLGGARKKFGIWNYEFDVLPEGSAKYAAMVDKFLPSSKFFYDVCLKNKISPQCMKILPHGVDWERFTQAEPLPLRTDKKHKFLVNFGQPHIRKNIPGTLEAFGRAFTKKDDVCLVIKCVDKKPERTFEISFRDAFNDFKKKFPNHAECLVLTEFIPEIERLYKACDGLFMLPHAEAFFLPALEMLAAGGVVITSNYGGQLDFLTRENAILIDGKMIRAPKEAQYWSSSVYSSMFEPNLDEAAKALQDCCSRMEEIKKEKLSNLNEIKNKFNWDNVAGLIENFYG